VEAGKAKQVAEEAESALLEADENAKGPRRTDKSRKQKMEAATKSIKEAQKANAEIEESYGTKADIKKKIAEYESNGNTAAARAYKDQLETYEKNEKKIGKGRETMDSLTAEADKREKALRICAGGGNGLSKAGIRADMSYRDAMSNIDGKLASSDLSDEDRKHLESVKSALEEVGEATYNSDAASVARIENDSYNKASEDRTKAQAKYDEAHKKTTDARNNLSSKMSSYNKSVELAAKLDEASDKSAYGSQTSTRYKLGKNGELQQVSKKSTLSNAYRATESIGRKNTLKKLGSKTQGLKSTMDDAIKTANGIKGPKEYTYADILNARLKDNEDMISGAYTDFDDASTAERDRAMTIVTSSGVDARSALDATTGVIGATSDITASDAKNVAINATSAATAGFRIRSTSRRSEFSIRAMLDACMTDGVLDFAAIDAEKTRHRSRHVDAALDKLKADYLAHATSELSHFGEEKTTTTVGEFIDSYKTDGRYNFEAMKSDLEASISKGGSSTGLETRIGECAATQRKYDQTSAKLAAGRAAVDAIGTMHAHEVERVSANTTRLKAVNGDVSVLNQIISQVESGHSVTLSDSQRRMIGSAIGARGGIIRTNDPTKIVEYATQARDAKREEQVRLTKDSEDHARQSAALGKELETMMNSVMGNIGARTQQPANNNVVNNNTTINNNNETTSPEQRYWFSGNQQSSDMPAASGLNQSRNMADMYERIQVEGIKHMESMLEQMRIESRAVAQDVKSVKKTVEEISED